MTSNPGNLCFRNNTSGYFLVGLLLSVIGLVFFKKSHRFVQYIILYAKQNNLI